MNNPTSSTLVEIYEYPVGKSGNLRVTYNNGVITEAIFDSVQELMPQLLMMKITDPALLSDLAAAIGEALKDHEKQTTKVAAEMSAKQVSEPSDSGSDLRTPAM